MMNEPEMVIHSQSPIERAYGHYIDQCEKDGRKPISFDAYERRIGKTPQRHQLHEFVDFWHCGRIRHGEIVEVMETGYLIQFYTQRVFVADTYVVE